MTGADSSLTKRALQAVARLTPTNVADNLGLDRALVRRFILASDNPPQKARAACGGAAHYAEALALLPPFADASAEIRNCVAEVLVEQEIAPARVFNLYCARNSVKLSDRELYCLSARAHSALLRAISNCASKANGIRPTDELRRAEKALDFVTDAEGVLQVWNGLSEPAQRRVALASEQAGFKVTEDAVADPFALSAAAQRAALANIEDDDVIRISRDLHNAAPVLERSKATEATFGDLKAPLDALARLAAMGFGKADLSDFQQLESRLAQLKWDNNEPETSITILLDTLVEFINWLDERGLSKELASRIGKKLSGWNVYARACNISLDERRAMASDAWNRASLQTRAKIELVGHLPITAVVPSLPADAGKLRAGIQAALKGNARRPPRTELRVAFHTVERHYLSLMGKSRPDWTKTDRKTGRPGGPFVSFLQSLDQICDLPSVGLSLCTCLTH